MGSISSPIMTWATRLSLIAAYHPQFTHLLKIVLFSLLILPLSSSCPVLVCVGTVNHSSLIFCLTGLQKCRASSQFNDFTIPVLNYSKPLNVSHMSHDNLQCSALLLTGPTTMATMDFLAPIVAATSPDWF